MALCKGLLITSLHKGSTNRAFQVIAEAASSQHSHPNISQVSAKSQLNTSALSCDVQVQLSAYLHVALACMPYRSYVHICWPIYNLTALMLHIKLNFNNG